MRYTVNVCLHVSCVMIIPQTLATHTIDVCEHTWKRCCLLNIVPVLLPAYCM